MHKHVAASQLEQIRKKRLLHECKRKYILYYIYPDNISQIEAAKCGEKSIIDLIFGATNTASE